MDRPFIAYKIGELEEAFAERSGDRQFMELLAVELTHRTTPRAAKLMAEVQSRLKGPDIYLVTPFVVVADNLR